MSCKLCSIPKTPTPLLVHLWTELSRWGFLGSSLTQLHHVASSGFGFIVLQCAARMAETVRLCFWMMPYHLPAHQRQCILQSCMLLQQTLLQRICTCIMTSTVLAGRMSQSHAHHSLDKAQNCLCLHSLYHMWGKHICTHILWRLLGWCQAWSCPYAGVDNVTAHSSFHIRRP